MLGIEVGGRWSDESLTFLRLLARAKARRQPEWLRACTAQAYCYRWSALLAVAAQKAFAATLLELPPGAACFDGDPPPANEVLADARWSFPVHDSRLPAA